MKRVGLLLVVLLVATLLGIQFKLNPGYVLISSDHYVIETRLWFAIFILILLFLILHTVIRVFRYTGAVPRRFRLWRSQSKQLKTVAKTNKGLIDLTNGDYKSAIKLLSKSSERAEKPLLNYLGSAIAAGRLGDLDLRDQYLAKAIALRPKQRFAIGLVQARLYFEAEQYEAAVSILKDLYEKSAKHEQVLSLLARSYEKLEDWHAVIELLPALKKHNALSDKEYQCLAINAYDNIFQYGNDVKTITAHWKKSSADITSQQRLIELYCSALKNLNAIEQAAKTIESALKQQWNTELVRLYGELNLENTNKQLQIAEAWLKLGRQDAELFYVLGTLCAKQKLWGKAKSYFQKSIDAKAMPKTYLAYAQLLEQLDDEKESLVYYRKGLLSTVSNNLD